MSDKYPGGFVTANAPAGFSVFFDGTGDGFSYTGTTFGSGAWTVELWFYFTGTSFTGPIGFFEGTTDSLVLAIMSSTTIRVDEVNVSNDLYTVPTMSANTWYHVAATKDASGNQTLFLNGVRSSTGVTTTSRNFSTATLRIGYSIIGATDFTGYISNLRFVTGTAVYDPLSTTINVPTQLFPISGTQLLICQSPTAIDNSSNAYTLSPNGTPRVSNFTPFAAYQGFNPALGAAAGGVWTIDEAAYYQQNRIWPIYDPYFNQTTLMLHGNSTGTVDSTGTPVYQNNTFLDSSANNFVITRNGNTTQGSFSPFSQTGWSNFFNGSTDYLSVPSSANLAIGTGDYTLEAWLYMSSTSFSNQCFYGGTSSGGPIFTIRSQTSLVINPYGSGDTCTFTGAYFPTNQWYHIAVTRQSSTARLFVNGVLASTTTDSGNYGQTVVGVGGIGLYYWTGYVSNLRFIKGTAVYTSSFTPSTTPLTAVTGTQLLTSQSQRFVDNSANNFAITANSTSSVQAFSPFVPAYITPTTYSNYFDGTGDYLTVPDNANLELGSGDFTIECWINTTVSNGGYVTAVSKWGSSNQSYMIRAASTDIGAGWSFFYSTNGSNYFTVFGSSINDGGWHHVAVTRSGNVFTTFTDGVLKNTTTDAVTLYNGTSSVTIGAGDAGANPFTGVISNLRIVKGTALYTASFTPPTAPLTAITNTQLLTCQSSTFVDNSANAFTITAAGNTLPVASPTPFPAKVDTTTLNSAYSTSLIGGSGYFDGTGDYLSCGSQSAYAFGTGNFTFEAWVYVPNRAAQYNIAATRASAGTVNGWNINITTSGGIVVFTDAFVFNNVGTVPINAWTHIAFTREGTGTNQTKIYINGVNVASATNNQDFSNTTLGVGNANDGSQYPFLGYISGVRLIKGTALYTSAFAPPTAPLTAITNTSLLLNYTNGAIFDNTAKNVLETVGNAQISTTQSKWGGSSMYFDGTGDYATTFSSTNFTLGTGNFTVECWFNASGLSGQTVLVTTAYPTDQQGFFLGFNNNTVYYLLGNGTWITNPNSNPSTPTISTGTWYHIALVRSGSVFTVYLNGTSISTVTDTVSLTNSNNQLCVGSRGTANYFNGYIDDMRITKGVARYITNFTPPTSQLQDQ